MRFRKTVVSTVVVNCDDGDVKLHMGSHEREGYVLTCMNKRWGPICRSDHDEAHMKTVCTQLGHSKGELVYSNV